MWWSQMWWWYGRRSGRRRRERGHGRGGRCGRDVVADVQAFSHRLDALVLLYHAGGLPRDTVVSCVNRLRQAGARLAGTVMNAYRPERTVHGGYYGDSYYYAAQNGEDDADPHHGERQSA